MIKISKNAEWFVLPPGHTASTPWEKVDSAFKRAIRSHLMHEQHGLCAYCMCELIEEKSRIEHFIPRSVKPELTLDYSNLILCCEGDCPETDEASDAGPASDRRKGKCAHCCDNNKNNRELSVIPNPSKEGENECLTQLAYTSDGLIYMPGEKRKAWKRDFDILNLNHPVLCALRRAAFRGMLKAATKRGIRWTADEIEKEIRRQIDPEQPTWEPFVGVIVYWLNRKLENARQESEP